MSQHASKITVDLNVNANDIDNRLLAGDIQVDQAGSGVQAAARARILSTPSLKSSSDDPVTGFMWFYYVNTKVAPLNNLHCREALIFAANKTELQTAYGGPFGGDIASTAIPPTVSGYSKIDPYNALTKPGGDITSAKQQLQACGHPNGFNLNIAYRSDRPREVASSQALQASLASVGIKATLKGYPASSYYSTFAGVPNYVHSHDLGLLAGGWGPDWPDAYGWGWALFDGGSIVPAGNTNIAEEDNPTVNNLFVQLEAGHHRLGPDQHLPADRQAGHGRRGAAAGGVLQGPAVPFVEPDERPGPAVLRHVQLRHHRVQVVGWPAAEKEGR